MQYSFRPSASPSIVESLDAIGREDAVEVEWFILQRHEVLAASNLERLIIVDGEADLAKRYDERCAVACRLFHEQVGILCGVGEAEQDRARLAVEEVPAVVPREGVADLFSLSVVESGHIRASQEDSARTNER